MVYTPFCTLSGYVWIEYLQHVKIPWNDKPERSGAEDDRKKRQNNRTK